MPPNCHNCSFPGILQSNVATYRIWSEACQVIIVDGRLDLPNLKCLLEVKGIALSPELMKKIMAIYGAWNSQ